MLPRKKKKPPGAVPPQALAGIHLKKSFLNGSKKPFYMTKKTFLIKHIFLGAFLFCFYFFDVKSIANKRGAPEAPPHPLPYQFYIEKNIKIQKNK